MGDGWGLEGVWPSKGGGRDFDGVREEARSRYCTPRVQSLAHLLYELSTSRCALRHGSSCDLRSHGPWRMMRGKPRERWSDMDRKGLRTRDSTDSRVESMVLWFSNIFLSRGCGVAQGAPPSLSFCRVEQSRLLDG
jgi:hypothetical protein